MPVTWKKTSRFNPEVLLKRIDSFRTVNPEGGTSFSGTGLGDCLPALQSMLNFPDAAKEVDASILVWEGLAALREPLTATTFLKSVNERLSENLATKLEPYRILTSVSVSRADVPSVVRIEGAKIYFLRNSYPSKYKSRKTLIAEQPLPIAANPNTYCNVVISVQAKSVKVAVTKAFRALDLVRAFWCLMGNARMELIGKSWRPINVARRGSIHTAHRPDGKPATQWVWFEPAYCETSIHRILKPALVKKNFVWAMQKIKNCAYGQQLVEALLRFVRALDEPDQNTAFLRLWTALETLASPRYADYDKLVRRCVFLFKDGPFHGQILEHLREFRNTSVHSGDESDRAKTYCFQLQIYFESLIWFHIRNANFFKTFDEANAFLDLPSDHVTLKRNQSLVKRALRFTA